MAECQDCGKGVGNNQSHCAACRNRRYQMETKGQPWIHECRGCGRPILSIKALCQPCDWLRTKARLRKQRLVDEKRAAHG